MIQNPSPHHTPSTLIAHTFTKKTHPTMKQTLVWSSGSGILEMGKARHHLLDILLMISRAQFSLCSSPLEWPLSLLAEFSVRQTAINLHSIYSITNICLSRTICTVFIIAKVKATANRMGY